MCQSPGPYEVAADCTAKFLTDTGVEVARVLIVDGGNEIYLFSETTGNAVYGVGKKIHTADDDCGLLKAVANAAVPLIDAFSSGSKSTVGPADLQASGQRGRSRFMNCFNNN